MRRSIATLCLSGSLEDKLAAIAAAGFDAADIVETDLICFDGSPADIRALASSLGLGIESYQPLRDFESADPALFARNLKRAQSKLDIVAELGSSLLVVSASTAPDAPSDEEVLARQLRALAELASEKGLRIGYKPMAWATHVRHIDQAARIVARAGHASLGLVADSFHHLAQGDTLSSLSAIPGERIFLLQLGDAPRSALDIAAGGMRYRCFPGQGDLDLAGFTAALLAQGYAGALSLETFSDDLRGLSARAAADDGLRSLLYLEELTAAHTGKPSGFAPPPAPPVTGVSFVEFAADGQPAMELDSFFASFGFARVGNHRSKNVALYRNGEVNLILNAQPGSFGQSYFLLHGPSICALGLRTADDQRAQQRALDYRCARFSGMVGPNELNIPAIRALDGSLVYFVSEHGESARLYEIDFDLKASAPSHGGAPLSGIDHIAYALRPGEMDSWVLFYRAVLGFEAEGTWVLADPNGIVKSRAMASEGHKVRIPLNISQGQRTTTAQTVNAHAGAGVHHVAFSTGDIFATVAHLRARGAALLAIPKNYYDDLALRFDLAPGFVEQLRGANVLYDRIGQGEFLHVYSRPFQDSFFFEFVQRIGGYDQYGAVNAPVRMAALARLTREEQGLALL